MHLSRGDKDFAQGENWKTLKSLGAQEPLSYYILYNESKHNNILGKMNNKDIDQNFLP